MLLFSNTGCLLWRVSFGWFFVLKSTMRPITMQHRYYMRHYMREHRSSHRWRNFDIWLRNLGFSTCLVYLRYWISWACLYNDSKQYLAVVRQIWMPFDIAVFSKRNWGNKRGSRLHFCKIFLCTCQKALRAQWHTTWNTFHINCLALT